MINHLLTISILFAGFVIGRAFTIRDQNELQANANVEEAKRIINNKINIDEY